MAMGKDRVAPPVKAAQNAGKTWQKAMTNMMPTGLKDGQRLLSEKEQVEIYNGRQDWAKLHKELGHKKVAAYIRAMEELMRQKT